MKKRWAFILARIRDRGYFRYLSGYSLIMAVSVGAEWALFTGMGMQLDRPTAAVLAGIAAAALVFYFNVSWNFELHTSKYRRAAVYYFIFAALSWSGQRWFYLVWLDDYMPYEYVRLIAAAFFLLPRYILDREVSFRDVKQHGVSFPAAGTGDLTGIRHRLSPDCDFFMNDVTDRTINRDAPDPETYRFDLMNRNAPPYKPVCHHIISRRPSEWLPRVLPYTDGVFVPVMSDDNTGDLLDTIRGAGKTAGVAVDLCHDMEDVWEWTTRCRMIMLTASTRRGDPDPVFRLELMRRLRVLHAHRCRSRITIALKGGFDDHVVPMLRVEMVVRPLGVVRHPEFQRLYAIQGAEKSYGVLFPMSDRYGFRGNR